jgi:hypothetical protein
LAFDLGKTKEEVRSRTSPGAVSGELRKSTQSTQTAIAATKEALANTTRSCIGLGLLPTKGTPTQAMPGSTRHCDTRLGEDAAGDEDEDDKVQR